MGSGYRHLFEIEGEVLLHRTVRQFAELGEVVLLAPPISEYAVSPAAHFTPAPNEEWAGIAMFGKTFPYMAPIGRTNIVFGDVWFSDDAIAKIAAHEGDWQTFGRSGPSKVTHTPYGEYFCYTLYPDHYRKFVEAMKFAHHRWAAQKRGRCTPWEVYWRMDGVTGKQDLMGKLRVGRHWTEVADWTDDFDYDLDVVNWTAARKAAGFGT